MNEIVERLVKRFFVKSIFVRKKRIFLDPKEVGKISKQTTKRQKQQEARKFLCRFLLSRINSMFRRGLNKKKKMMSPPVSS